MEFYLVNNTEFSLSEQFLSWLFAEIVVQLPQIEKQKCVGKEVGVVLVNTDEMTRLNRQYRGKDRVTDILSFDLEGDQLGELVLCSEIVVRQAQEHSLHVSEELAYLLIHGILHLLGHDHESPDDERKMFAIQDHIFEVLQEQGIVGKF